ncbi:serine protease [Herbaspirillum seropedicae]|uniref:serine protease n=1 Tax=Herbaspirillum seropedicae TaxID=964 RepID=UPI00286707DC|nr:serine protease [Herbaspirillum seropedicae]MDR6394827.1 hypothetical protein [Herbaspirillum seropedicae]
MKKFLRKYLHISVLIGGGIFYNLGYAQESFQLSNDLTIEIGKRLIVIQYPIKGEDGQVTGRVDGSGYLLDEHHAVTAAHVVRAAANNTLIIQVGGLALGTNYLTTGRVLKIDPKRDLAMVWVDTIPFNSPYVVHEEKAQICKERPPANSGYLLGGLAVSSTGSQGSIERRWNPFSSPDRKVLNVQRVPEFVTDQPVHWRVGMSVVALSGSPNHGDSGAAILSTSGCVFGVVSSVMTLKKPAEGLYSGVAFGEPLLQDDPLLSDYLK